MRSTPFVRPAIATTRSCTSGGRLPSRDAVRAVTRTCNEAAPRVRVSAVIAARRRASARRSGRSPLVRGTARHAKRAHRPSSLRFRHAHHAAAARLKGKSFHNHPIARNASFQVRLAPSTRDDGRPNPSRWISRSTSSPTASRRRPRRAAVRPGPATGASRTSVGTRSGTGRSASARRPSRAAGSSEGHARGWS
jgi:hypothetical protein